MMNMLQYIKRNACQHPDACYTSVDDLVELFQNAIDDKFLEEFLPQIERMRLEKVRLNLAVSSRPLSPSPDEAPTADKPKKGLGSLIKNLSSRSNSNIPRRESEIQPREAPEQAQLEQLAQQERVLIDRLQGLTQSANRNLSLKARKVYDAMQPEVHMAGHRANSSASSSSGATSRASSEEFAATDRTTLSPQPILRARSKEQRPVFVAGTDVVGSVAADDSLIRRKSYNNSGAKTDKK